MKQIAEILIVDNEPDSRIATSSGSVGAKTLLFKGGSYAQENTVGGR